MPRFLIHTKETRHRTYSVEARSLWDAEREFAKCGDGLQKERDVHDPEHIDWTQEDTPTRGALR